MNNTYKNLAFDKILNALSQHALTEGAKEQCLAITPFMRENICVQKMQETTAARHILDTCGSPPLTAMQGVAGILTQCAAGAMLLPAQLALVEKFLAACRRMQQYLEKAIYTDEVLVSYAASFNPLAGLCAEIARCIRGDAVNTNASPAP